MKFRKSTILLISIFIIMSFPFTKALPNSVHISSTGIIHYNTNIIKAVTLYGSEEVAGDWGNWDDILDQLVSLNVNTVIISAVDIRGYVMWIPKEKYWYQAKYGVENWGGDILGQFTIKAHQRGLKVFVSVSLFKNERIWKNYPELRAVYNNNQTDLGDWTSRFICPVSDYIDEYIKPALNEILHEYSVDGIIFDYVRFSAKTGLHTGFHPNCKENFESIYGNDVDWNKDMNLYDGLLLNEFKDWKRSIILDTISDLKNYIRSIDHSIPIYAFTIATKGTIKSDGTFGLDYGLYGVDYSQIGAILDGVCPMFYTFSGEYLYVAADLIKNTIHSSKFIPTLSAKNDLNADFNDVIPIGIEGSIIFTYAYTEFHNQQDIIYDIYNNDENFV